LKKGYGPSGIVLLPDGQPASDAKLIYAAGREQFILTNRTLETYYGSNKLDYVTNAGPDGKFAFNQRAGGIRLFAVHPAGWFDAPVDSGSQGLKVHLQPWTSVAGYLMNSNGTPATNVELQLTMFNGEDWNRDAIANMWESIYTDARGYFIFTNVPPRRLELQRLTPLGGGKTYTLQTSFEARPGTTNDLGKITIDSPPAPSVTEQLKKKIGL
jgi:hypothetical protein